MKKSEERSLQILIILGTTTVIYSLIQFFRWLGYLYVGR